MMETPNAVNLRDRGRVLLGKSNWPDIKQVYSWPFPFTGHVREYTKNELRWVLQQAGFSEVRVLPVNRVLWQSGYRGRSSNDKIVTKYHRSFRVNSLDSVARLLYFVPVFMIPNLRDTLVATFRKPP